MDVSNGKPILDSSHNYQNHHRNNLDFGQPLAIYAAVLRHLFDSQSVFHLKCLKLVKKEARNLLLYLFKTLFSPYYSEMTKCPRTKFLRND